MMMDIEEASDPPPVISGPQIDPQVSFQSQEANNNKNTRKRTMSSPPPLRNPPRTDYFFIGQPEEKFLDDGNLPFFANSELNRERYGKEGSLTLEEIKEAISSPLLYKKDSLASAELDLCTGRVRLNNNGKTRGRRVPELYGYDEEVENKSVHFLWPEEALYLLEIGKLQIVASHMDLSIERARALLLHPMGHSNANSCDIEDYSVYKSLSKLGYRLRRRVIKKSEEKRPEKVEEEEMEVETNEGGAEAIPEIQLDSDSDPGSSIPHVQEASPGSPLLVAEPGDFNVGEVSPGSPGGEGEHVKDDSGSIEYIVHEADSDSDVEFVQEVRASHGIEFQELENVPGYVYECEAGPSSSTKAQVMVDLVSDSDEENESSRPPETFHSILDQFKPKSCFSLGFPPSPLLPPNIQPRNDNFSIPIHLNPRGVVQNNEELGVEMLVDDLRIDSDGREPLQTKIPCNNWREWRQIVMREGSEMINASLLGQSKDHEVAEKLHQWPRGVDASEPSEKGYDIFNLNILRVPYDLYTPQSKSLHRRALVKSKPYARIAIARTRSDGINLKSQIQDPLENLLTDEVPLIIALVGDNSDIIYLSSNGTPLPSLFSPNLSL